jgi:hypothetical protein
MPTPKSSTKKKLAVNAQPELPRAVAKVLAGSKPSADSGALLAELIEAWGGVGRLARDVAAEFQTAPKGGMVRQRILEMMQRLVLTTTATGLAKTRNPADMPDEELEAVAMNYLKRMTSNPQAGDKQ